MLVQVGDLVTTPGKLFVDGVERIWIGVVVEPAQPERWIVYWNDGKTENIPEHLLECMEVINESR